MSDWRKFKGSRHELEILCSNINAMQEQIFLLENNICAANNAFYSGQLQCTEKQLQKQIKEYNKQIKALQRDVSAANRRLTTVKYGNIY